MLVHRLATAVGTRTSLTMQINRRAEDGAPYEPTINYENKTE